ncbi:hypothetical protein [Aestuariivivens insulae]|uniref:hypothetical protein n=1 Tax=Aestuariivivens insulae TaxID=1621988 RepID=UPI001F59479C|nr:hypothetical protein [Aestuariivivens insulae]
MKKILIYTFLSLVLLNCSGGSDEEVKEVVIPKKPTAASLVFPEQNSECTEGTNITTNNSTITFDWTAGSDTDSYELTLKNLVSGEITKHSATNTEISIELFRATPYSWFVTSKSNSVTDTATSATWKFYNAGEGNVNYAPFPAAVVAPAHESSMASTTTVTLEWSGSDVDNDIASYDVYFGTTESPALLNSGITASSLVNVSVTSGTAYYWYVVTNDEQGNSSTSELFKFNVN